MVAGLKAGPGKFGMGRVCGSVTTCATLCAVGWRGCLRSPSFSAGVEVGTPIRDMTVFSISHWQSAMEFDLSVEHNIDMKRFISLVQAEIPAVPALSRFYYFPSDVDLNARTEVHDNPSLELFMVQASSPLSTLKLYISPGPTSPGEAPTPSFASLPRAEVETLAKRYFSSRLASRGPRTASSVHSETSSNRRAIRSAVLPRDSACVVCGESRRAKLEASHKASVAFVRSCGLSSTELSFNGVMLCNACHKLFDAFFWCVRKGKVVVSDALKRHPSLGVAWRARSGAHLRLNDVFRREWPAATAWAAHQRAFCMMEGEDPQSREPPVVCDHCWSVFVDAPALSRHRCRAVSGGGIPEEAGGEDEAGGEEA